MAVNPKKIPVSQHLTDSDESKCTVNNKKLPNSHREHSIKLHCTFGRRKFVVTLNGEDGGQATFAHLAEAIRAETDIPCDKQRLLFKGIIMDPPDMSGFSTLQELNIRSGDQILIVNSRRVGIDDVEKRNFEEIFPRVQETDKELQELFYELDKMQRGYFSCRDPNTFLDKLRIKAMALEKDYMKYIQIANNLTFDYRNAVDQAKRRELIDTCQRQIDKIEEFTSAIYDRLALTQSSVGGAPVLKVAYKDGPCPRVEKIYEGPCN